MRKKLFVAAILTTAVAAAVVLSPAQAQRYYGPGGYGCCGYGMMGAARVRSWPYDGLGLCTRHSTISSVSRLSRPPFVLDRVRTWLRLLRTVPEVVACKRTEGRSELCCGAANTGAQQCANYLPSLVSPHLH